ncbi:MAG: hypothetical protein K2Y33_15750 [Mycolicibacterium frederiksbergense]|nr:hypothetical protein [Mycolicibacterium frederiksbergense]
MSGSNAGKPPDNAAELIRDLQREVLALKQKTSVRIGTDWVLHAKNGVPTLTGPGGQSIPLTQPVTIVEQPVLDVLEDEDTG